MRRSRTTVALAVTAFSALFVASISLEPAFAREGGRGSGGSGFSGGGGGGGGARAFSGGGSRSFSGGGSRSFSGGSMRSFSGGRSYDGGSRQFSRTFRSPSVGSSRSYGYRSHGHRHHGRHHHHRHRHGHALVYGVPLAYGYYGYSESCYWLRRRAVSSGSSYWWNRYYDCINGYSVYLLQG